MPASQQHIHAETPMGANLHADGATFRVWAPAARQIHLLSDLTGWTATGENALVVGERRHWTGFFPGFQDGSEYKFWVVGEGDTGFKRDPYARELGWKPAFPHCNCVVRDPHRYPWRVPQFRPPPFHEWLIFQLHIGAFDSPRGGSQPGSFFDVMNRIPYLRDLGFNVVQLLPVQEAETRFSLGYNGGDYFSPENNYALRDVPAHLLQRVNELFAAKGFGPLSAQDLEGSSNQLRCLVDLLHAYGLAVIFDVVYNHAGGWEVDGKLDDESIFFFDRQPKGDNNRSQFFTSQGESGGLCFALWQEPVRQFLIDNAKFLLEEFRVDGFRHDHVRIIFEKNAANGWKFCQHLTASCKAQRPDAIQHAECWPPDPDVTKPVWEEGAGFDTCYVSDLRNTLWGALEQASQPWAGPVGVSAVLDSLRARGFHHAWQGIQQIETHDEVYRTKPPRSRTPRRSDGENARSWFARSRSRVALGLVLTAPGIPMIFMGQEFLEDKLWADDVQSHADLRLHWAGLDEADPSMRDHLRFTRELAWLHRQLPGLTGEGYRSTHGSDQDRVLAFHRWVPGAGHDVIIVASLNNDTLFDYRIGFPFAGPWKEAFNSDIYDRWVNPTAHGNNGSIFAHEAPWQEFLYSAPICIPANTILVFTRG